MESETTEIALRPAAEAPGVTAGRSWLMPPTTLEEAMKVATMLAASSFVPSGFKNKPGDVLCAIQYGAEIGLPPLQALQGVAVVNGRPSVWGDAALAIVLASGTVEDLDEKVSGEGEAMAARFFARRIGRATPIEQTFSVADAKTAGLWKKQGPWTTAPKRMLQMRARAFGLRDGWADYLKGLSIREEAQDIDVTPATPIAEPRPVATETAAAPAATPGGYITDEERKALFAACRDNGRTLDDLKAKLALMGIEASAKIPASEVAPLMAWAKDEPQDLPPEDGTGDADVTG